jgi:hypothetical protein
MADTAFEDFLISKGYVKHKQDGREIVPTNEQGFSSYKNIGYIYINGPRVIHVNLGEKHMPPHIISTLCYKFGDKVIYSDRGDLALRAVKDIPFDDILQSLEWGKPLELSNIQTLVTA